MLQAPQHGGSPARRSPRCARQPLRSWPRIPTSATTLACDGDPELLFSVREREQRGSPHRPAERLTVGEGCLPRACRAPPTREPGEDRHEGARDTVLAPCLRGGSSVVRAAPVGVGALPPPRRSTRCWPPGSPMPTSSTRGSRRRRSAPRTSGASTARRRGARLVQAVLPVLRRRHLAQGDDAHPSSAAGGAASATRFHIFNGDIISMPDKWEYPWSRRGTWRSTRLLRGSSTSTSRCARSSCCSCSVSLLSPPYRPDPGVRAGNSATSRLLSTHGPRVFLFLTSSAALGCARTSTSSSRSFHGLASQLELVGDPQGSSGRNVFSRDAASSASTTSGSSTELAPAHGRQWLEQAEGTAWMALYCQNMIEIVAHPRGEKSPVRRIRGHLPAALHLDRLRDGPRRRQPGTRCGTRRTASTTTCCACPTGPRSASRCGRWWACSRCARAPCSRPTSPSVTRGSWS